MSFGNSLFLYALAAVAAPVIIHLIFRLRKRVVTFGSLRFLEKIVKKNRKRLRLRDLILLLLRVAAVALIAFAFARPYLRGPGAAGDAERRDTVFVLDDSFSMRAARLARTAFDEAKARTIDELGSLRPGDRAALVLASGGGRVVSPLAADLSAVRSKVRAAVLTYERAELAPALRAASGLLSTSKAPHRRVAVASDLQRTSWTEAALAALPKGEVEYTALLPASSEPNLAVVGAEPVSDFWTPGVPVGVRVRVANFGSSRASGVNARLLVGTREAPRARRMVTVPAGGEAAIELAFDASAAGEFPATVEIEGRDALPADDRRHLVLSLRDRLHVLCVQDEVFERDKDYFRRRDFLRDESYFLARALDPRLDPNDAPLSPYAPADLAARELDAGELRRADAVCLLGVTKLSEEQAKALADHVRAGGGLVVAPSGRRAPSGKPDVDMSAAAKALADRLMKAGIAPAKVVKALEAGPVSPEGIPIVKWDRAPVWKAFKDATGTGPDRARVKRYLELTPAASEDKGVRVIAEFEGGKPAVVERRTEGGGRVVQLAFGLATRSTNFPKRKAYVPFVHGLVGYLARSAETGGARAVEVGEPLPVARALGELEGASGTAELLDPDGSRVTITEAGAAPLPERPGIYRVRSRRGGAYETRFLAANPPAAESDLRTEG
ncbi:MAG: BatA domain-containing protein, partial [Planctomycetota bacterium]